MPLESWDFNGLNIFKRDFLKSLPIPSLWNISHIYPSGSLLTNLEISWCCIQFSSQLLNNVIKKCGRLLSAKRGSVTTRLPCLVWILPGVHPDLSGCHPGVKPDLSGCHPAAILHPAYQQLPHLQDYQVNYIYIQQFYYGVSHVNFFFYETKSCKCYFKVYC